MYIQPTLNKPGNLNVEGNRLSSLVQVQVASVLSILTCQTEDISMSRLSVKSMLRPHLISENCFPQKEAKTFCEHQTGPWLLK